MSFRVRGFPNFHHGFVYDLGLVKARVTLVESEDAQLDPPKRTEPLLVWEFVRFDLGLLMCRRAVDSKSTVERSDESAPIFLANPT